MFQTTKHWWKYAAAAGKCFEGNCASATLKIWFLFQNFLKLAHM
jgi:hypothetical protein